MDPSAPENAIKLFLIPGSSSLFPHILLRYANIPFTPVQVWRSELSGDQFRNQINDKSQVPVLQIGDNSRKITENLAIAYTIHELAPEKHLFGATSKQRIQVLEWLSWLTTSLHAQAWGAFLRPYRFTSETSACPAIKETSRQRVLVIMDRLERNLSSDGPYALGSQFTAIDAYILIFYRIGTKLLGVDMGERFPKWTKVVGYVEKLQSVVEALEYEAGLPSDPAT